MNPLSNGGPNDVEIPNAEEAKEPERRRSLRVPLRVLRVETELSGEVFFGYATNVSITGLHIQSSNPKEPGTQVQVRFSLPDSEEPIVCRAEVVWARNFEGKSSAQPGMGLRFVDLNPKESEMIDEFVRETN